MCGIAGVWLRQGGGGIVDPGAAVELMTRCIVHRGPDGSGRWTSPDNRLALGHRRLSILDLSADGAQPMHSASGRYVIVFNGEIYNFRTLREQLAAGGARFRGHSDTEVLLEAVEQWGLPKALDAACGMFALALWDAHTATLHLARDRAGEKPLYYGTASGRLVFGSELKSLAAVPGTLGRISPEALAGFMRLSFVPGPLAIWDQVWKLEPGHIRSFTVDGDPRGTPLAFWRLDAAVTAGASGTLDATAPATLATLDTLLTTVVGEQMVADVPLGALLSGGIDSSLVVAVMQAQSSRPVQTFTIGFAEREFNEAPHARLVAEHLGTEHTELVVTAQDALDVIPLLPDMYDEPFADSSAIPTHLVAKLARSRVTVALSGDGGDEVFAGYTRYSWAQRAWHALAPLPPAARRIGSALIRSRTPAAWDRSVRQLEFLLPRRFRQSGAGTKLHKVAHLVDSASFDDVYERLISNWWDGHGIVRHWPSRAEAVPDWLRATHLPDDPLSRMQYRDFHGYLVDDIMVKVDRASMAVGLETRAPLLDRRLVEFAWRIPAAQRVMHGQGKWLLRQLLYRHVPASIIDRPKQGFGIPIGAWLRGPLAEWAGDLVADIRADDPDLHGGPVREMWSAHRARDGGASAALWNVLMFLAWRERWAKGTGA